MFYGYSAKIFDYLNAIVPIKRFPFELRTLAHEPNDAEGGSGLIPLTPTI